MAASEAEGLVHSVGDPSHLSRLSSGLNDLRQQADFCDVTIIVGGQRFPAHKAVLTSASDYFQGMFSAGFQESAMSEITVSGTAESFAQIVEFLYTGHFTLTSTAVVGVLEMACYMVLTAVVNLCAEYLKHVQDKLTKEDCFEVWSIASNHSNISDIAKLYKRIVVHNFLKCVQSRLFLENSSVSTMMDILSDEEIETDDITEEQILEGTMIWMRHDSDQRKVHAVDLLKKIRLGLVPVDRLHQILGEELLSVPECKIMVDAVVKLSANKDTAIPPLNKSHPDLFATRNTITAQVYVDEEHVGEGHYYNKIISFLCLHESGSYMLDKLKSNLLNTLSCKTSELRGCSTVVSKTGQLYMYACVIKEPNERQFAMRKDYFIRYNTEQNEWCVLPPIPIPARVAGKQVLMHGLDHHIYAFVTDEDMCTITRFNIHSKTWEIMTEQFYQAMGTSTVDNKGILINGNVLVEGPDRLEDADDDVEGGGFYESRIKFYKIATNECLDVTYDAEKGLDLEYLINFKYESRRYLVQDFHTDNVTKVYQCTCDFESDSPSVSIGESVDGELYSRVVEELRKSYDTEYFHFTFDKNKLEMVSILKILQRYDLPTF